MSDADREPQEQTSDGPSTQLGSVQRVEPVGDWLLAQLIDFMAVTGMANEITVVCGGVLVTGVPISEKRFFEALGDSLVRVAEEGSPIFWDSTLSEDEQNKAIEVLQRLQRTMRETLSRQGTQLTDRLKSRMGLGNTEEDDGQKDGPKFRSYINLERATIWAGHNNEIDVPLWRGRMSEVSGWHLGRYGIDPYELADE